MGFLRPIDHLPGWSGCSCGIRRRSMEIINLEAWITASGKYPERMDSDELTQEVKDNAVILLNKVNQLLKDLGITEASVSSGFRPSSVNNATPHAAKRSLHMSGKAVDIFDPNGTLDNLVISRPDLLKKYELWVENPSNTATWCHLDWGTRADRDLRMFNP